MKDFSGSVMPGLGAFLLVTTGTTGHPGYDGVPGTGAETTRTPVDGG